MTELKLQQEDTLEEMWRIKREIAAEYPTWEAYVAGIQALQEEERKRGVKFAELPPRRPDNTETASPRCVVEDAAGYGASGPP